MEQKSGISSVAHYNWIDLLRCIAVILVYYGHMVTVATYSPSIPEAIADGNSALLPLIPAETHFLDALEMFFISRLHAQTAVVGVCLFFLLAGYLAVGSVRKNTKQRFLTGRAIRIYPVMWAVTVLCILTLLFVQNIRFSAIEIIGQLTLLTPLFQVRGIVAGVVWTLYVEIIYYLLISIPNKFDLKCIVVIDVISALSVVVFALTNSSNMMQISYYLKYIPIIMIGTTVKLLEDDDNVYKRALFILFSIAFAWGVLRLNQILNGDSTTYPGIGTWIVSLIVFFGIYFLGKKADKRIPKFFSWMAKISYPLYLIQVCIGFNVMFLIKKIITDNAYIIEVCTLLVLLILSTAIHLLIENGANKWWKKKATGSST